MWRYLGVWLLMSLGSVQAQTPPAEGPGGADNGVPAGTPPAADGNGQGAVPAKPPAGAGGVTPASGAKDAGRQAATSGFMSPAMMVHRAWLQVQAAQIRDYCDTPRIPPERLQRILERFSRYSGQPEDCQTVRKY